MQRNANGDLVCGVDMLYCCFGSSQLSSQPPEDWQQRFAAVAAGAAAAAGSSSTAATRDPPAAIGGAATPATAASAQSGTATSTADSSSSSTNAGGTQQLQGYMIALIVVLPVLALASAVALYGTLRWAKHEIRRNASAGSSNSGDVSSSTALPLAPDSDGPPAAAVVLGVAGYAAGGPTEQHQEPLIAANQRSSSSRGPGFGFQALLSPRARRQMGLNDSCYVGADAAECGKAGAAVGSRWLCWKSSAAADGNSRLQQQQQQGLGVRKDTALHPDSAAAAAAGSSSPKDGLLLQHALLAPNAAAADELHTVQLVQMSCTVSASDGDSSAAAAAGVQPSGGSYSSSCSGSRSVAARGVTFAADAVAIQQSATASQWQVTPQAAAAAGRLVDLYGAPIQSDVLSPEQLAFVYQQQQPQLLRMVRHRRATLPEGVLSKAIEQMQKLKQQQQQQQQQQEEGGMQGAVDAVASSSSSSCAGDSTGCAAMVIGGACGSSSSPKHAEGYVKR
jgi:hypothetical protein